MSDRDANQRWIELLVRLDPADAALVADLLSTLASGGVVEEPAIRPHDDADFAYDLLDQPTVLRAFFPASTSTSTRRAVRRRLDALPLHAPLPRLRWSSLTPVDWVDEWRRFYQPIEVGQRLLLCPSWLEPPQGGDRIVITLDPGAAFGTGQHPTTRLCLAALEDTPLEAARVLDLGCGSGVLAIAAAKLGGSDVLACDIDPQAVEVARHNVAANDVRVELTAGTIEDLPPCQPFDVVVANISSTVTSALAASIARLLRPGGRAILSGFLARDRALVTTAAVAAGLELLCETTDEGWCVLVGQRR